MSVMVSVLASDLTSDMASDMVSSPSSGDGPSSLIGLVACVALDPTEATDLLPDFIRAFAI